MDWIQTYTGGMFHPMNPRADELRLADISAGLSKVCRFAGQCIKFYSVAEHSVLMAEVASKGNQLTALMHDASEAYLTDVPRPIKRCLTGYAGMEHRLMQVIADKYKTLWPLPPEVKQLDNQILTDEREQNMAAPPSPWLENEKALGVKLKFWTPAEANWNFTNAFYRYGGKE